MQKFSRLKFSMQQVPRTKSARKMFQEQKSVSRGEKPIYKFLEEKNQRATSLTKKNQHAASSMNRISTQKDP